MKTHKFKLIILFISSLLFSRCNVDEYTFQGKTTKENLTKDEGTARSALAGIYEAVRPNGRKGFTSTMMNLTVCGTQQRAVSKDTELIGYYNNNIKPINANRSTGGVIAFYKSSYRGINLANYVITSIEKNGIPRTSKKVQNEILAEAKALRAHAYFNVLRVFGQFYNPESEYGIITTTKPITNNTYLTRNKVSDTYDLMIKDLEFALQNVPLGNNRNSVTRTYVKGLLAKIYLYKGGTNNWSKTVSYCKDIINNLGGKFNLEAKYSEIFKKGIESNEIIFAPYYNKKNQRISDLIVLRKENIEPSEYFKNLAKVEATEIKEDQGTGSDNGTDGDGKDGDGKDDDGKDDDYGGYGDKKTAVKFEPRYKFTFEIDTLKKTKDIYAKYHNAISTYQFLRVAEVYLIYAEALARTDGNMQEALVALNKIRDRAGLKPKKYIDKATLLEDIRKEKMFELSIENAQSWFDLVRYHQLGDLDATKLKPSIKNVNQFISPIPLRILRNNPKFGPQNPGYSK